MSKSVLEAEFELLIRACKWPSPIEQMRFCERRWRCDYCWTDYNLIVEIEGGTHNQGRHVRPEGYQHDCEKYNEAQLLGYIVIRFVGEHLKNGYAVQLLTDFFEKRKRL